MIKSFYLDNAKVLSFSIITTKLTNKCSDKFQFIKNSLLFMAFRVSINCFFPMIKTSH